MADAKTALKCLTKNDVSWIQPKANSHQSAFNLPVRAFDDMFFDLLQIEGIAPKKAFIVQWFSKDGELLIEAESNVVYYHSKNEYRLLNIPREEVKSILIEKNFLLFRRISTHLYITEIGFGGIHLANEFNRQELVEKLPKR